jgi:hypothetical protein
LEHRAPPHGRQRAGRHVRDRAAAASSPVTTTCPVPRRTSPGCRCRPGSWRRAAPAHPGCGVRRLLPPPRALILAGLEEPQDAQGADCEAVDGERGQGPGLEPADKEPYRQVRGDPAHDDAEHDLTVGRRDSRGSRGSRASRRTSALMFLRAAGLPVLPRMDLAAQRRQTISRCQRRIVSGVTSKRSPWRRAWAAQQYDHIKIILGCRR